ncbi:1,4-alpha-glucan branching protein GlgB [Pseudactinotalea sp. HY158]|uniref:1,4-alpha-glucan branching protein GlgB n=1 Tax=Pseudactinotalea sp. HY158 TaxID=2654547 RepID=UPI001E2AC8B9|nr:1,4-alpha-glucan branching protein GlgB [Pseudactinotalea sp. HY158]
MRLEIAAVRSAAGVVAVQVPVVLAQAGAPGPATPEPIASLAGWDVFDGPTHPAFLPAWLGAATTPTRPGLHTLPGPAAGLDLAAARAVRGEQSNSSIIVPRADGAPGGAILKVFRVIAAGANPDVEVPLALARAGGSRHVPAVLGWLEGRFRDPATLATVTGHLGVLAEFVPGAEDGFAWACERAGAGADITAEMRSLGGDLADLHGQLRAALPVPDDAPRETAADLRGRADWALARVPRLTGDTARTEAIHAVLTRAMAGREPPPPQRIHGDLHLGQVLHAGRAWHILDFEGEPLRPLAERRRPGQPMRDVAGLLRSLDYAAAVGGASDPAWLRHARAGLLAGYLDHPSHVDAASDPAGLPGLRRLLQAYELDKALYEAAYESQHRPDWISIPLAAIDRILQENDMTATSQPGPAQARPAAALLEAVAQGGHFAPHDVLGAHPAGGTVTLRALRHLAESVAFVTADGRVPARHLHGGIWEAELEAPGIPDYRVEVTYEDGVGHIQDDPYRHLPTIGDMDLHLIAEGRHEELWTALGSHAREFASALGPVTGVSFAVWAPNARAVRVIGDFNGWDGREAAMRSLGSSGIWEVFLPGVEAGAKYKYEVCHADGSWHAKADPLARATEVPPSTASVVTDDDYVWSAGDEAWMAHRRTTNPHTGPMSVYEVHLGSWRAGLSYLELAEQLVEYVQWMGFTHVEFLPVSEHPYGPSWGYQVTSYYAPTARFGTPDELRHLIDALHSAGIGVLLDWVPAHFPKDSWALARFDGTALYEHADPLRGEHQDWGTLIFDFGRNEVRNFLVASALYWLSEFHIDGLRVDAVASMLYLDYSRNPGEWRPNARGGRENLEAIQFLQEVTATAYRVCPGIIMIAEESTAWPGVTSPTSVSGLGFGLKWNMGWMNDTLRYLAEDPVNRRYHHGELTFSLVYAFSEQFLLPLSHDEVVHGKGSLLAKLPGDRWQQLAGLRALFAYQWSHPGKKLLFMGGEFGQEAEWAESRSLDWGLGDTPDHSALRECLRDLNLLYAQEPALWADDFSHEGFQWLEAGAGDDNLIAYLRVGAGRQVAVVVNFAGVPHEDYRIPVPQGGRWREVLNTDALRYGGSGVENTAPITAEARPWGGRSHSIPLRVPPLGATFLVPEDQ